LKSGDFRILFLESLFLCPDLSFLFLIWNFDEKM